MPRSTKTITIQGQSFTLSYPNVGQYIDIKVLESKLAQGQVQQLVSATPAHLDAYLFITTYAHFTVLCPELLSKLKVNSLLDLSIDDFEELSEVYLKEIQPWLDSIKKEMKQGMKDAKEGV